MELISIVIPIYKVEKYLRECIDSVLKQTYSQLEIILVDDGSPDNCGAICDEYAASDSRIHVIHKENGGLSDARNAGMKIASGKYIYFLDSDDYLLPNAMERLVLTAEEKQTDILFMDAQNFNDEGFVPRFRESLIHKNSYPLAGGAEVVNSMFRNDDYNCAVYTHFYRRDFLASVSVDFVKGLLFEDLAFNGSAFPMAERVCGLNETLYMRRLRADSIMTRKGSLKNVSSYQYNFNLFLEKYDNLSEEGQTKEAYRNLAILAANMCIIRYSEVSGQEKKQARELLKQNKKKLKAHKYLNSKKLVTKYSMIGLFSAYRNCKDSLAKMSLKHEEKRFEGRDRK